MGHAALGLAVPTPQACLNFVPSRPRAWQLPWRRGWPAAPQVKFNAAQAVFSPAPPVPLVPCTQMRPHPSAPREPLGRVEREGPSSPLALGPPGPCPLTAAPQGPLGAGPAVPEAACGEGGRDCEPKAVLRDWRCPFFPGGYCEPTPLGVSTALGLPWLMLEDTWGPQAGLATGLWVVSGVSLRRGQQAGPLTNGHP